MKKKITASDLVLIIIIGLIIWPIFGIKNSILFIAIYCAFMWMNLTATTVCNALTYNETDKKAIVFRWMYILISSICFGICLI